MSKPKGLQWTEKELKIAYALLIEKKTRPEVEKELGASHSGVWKVWHALQAGNKPPMLELMGQKASELKVTPIRLPRRVRGPRILLGKPLWH